MNKKLHYKTRKNSKKQGKKVLTKGGRGGNIDKLSQRARGLAEPLKRKGKKYLTKERQ